MSPKIQHQQLPPLCRNAKEDNNNQLMLQTLLLTTEDKTTITTIETTTHIVCNHCHLLAQWRQYKACLLQLKWHSHVHRHDEEVSFCCYHRQWGHSHSPVTILKKNNKHFIYETFTKVKMNQLQKTNNTPPSWQTHAHVTPSMITNFKSQLHFTSMNTEMKCLEKMNYLYTWNISVTQEEKYLKN